MSQRLYLLNTTMLSSDDAALREAAASRAATVVEVAEANHVVPLAWLAYFRPENLQPCLVKWEESHDLMLPCASLQRAIDNLRGALPLFEAFTGEKKWAREYWQTSMYDLLQLQLPYLTLDLAELLMTMQAPELNAAIRTALGGDAAAVKVIREHFTSYHAGVEPYPQSEFLRGNLADEKRRANTVALRSGIIGVSPGAFRGQKRIFVMGELRAIK